MPWQCSCGYEAGDYDVICSKCGSARPGMTEAEIKLYRSKASPSSGNTVPEKPGTIGLLKTIGVINLAGAALRP